MKLKIKKFDISKMAPDAVVLLVGKRGTGKSTMLKDILYNMRHTLYAGVAMCPTEDSVEGENGLSSFIPPSLVHDKYKPEVIRRLLNYQKKFIKANSKEKAKRMFIVLDDCMYEKNVMKGEEMREVHMNGRHRKLFFINAVQYMMDIPPALRTNIDYVFALKENIIGNRERLWRHLFGMFKDYASFGATMDTLTNGFSAMVLDNKVRSTNVEDCVFWYEADARPKKFRMCNPVYWQLDKECKKNEDDSESDSNQGGSTKQVFIQKVQAMEKKKKKR